jgi:hypothetical protein
MFDRAKEQREQMVSQILKSDAFGPLVDRIWPISCGLSPWRRRLLRELCHPDELKKAAIGLIRLCDAIRTLNAVQ